MPEFNRPSYQIFPIGTKQRKYYEDEEENEKEKESNGVQEATCM